MLKFKFFNKDKSEEVNVKVESDNKTIDKTIDKIKEAANEKCIERYNDSVIDNLKAKLMLQYSIESGIYGGMIVYHEEEMLVDAICKDIAKEMNLLK